MRYISKGDVPAALRDWLADANEDWTPTWDAFGGAPKAETKAALLAEQGSLCAYCCERVDAARTHIEHVVPKSGRNGDPARALDYTNFVASCFGEETGEEGEAGGDPRLRRGSSRDLHCGHHKGSSFDPARFVSPLSAECEAAFAFTAIGRIEPTEAGGTRAEYTIRLLNLNADRLRRGREAAITGVEEVLAGLDVDERRALFSRLSDRGADGAYRQYYPAVLSALSYLAPHLPG